MFSWQTPSRAPIRFGPFEWTRSQSAIKHESESDDKKFQNRGPPGHQPAVLGPSSAIAARPLPWTGPASQRARDRISAHESHHREALSMTSNTIGSTPKRASSPRGVASGTDGPWGRGDKRGHHSVASAKAPGANSHGPPILIAKARWTTLQWRLAMETGNGDWRWRLSFVA